PPDQAEKINTSVVDGVLKIEMEDNTFIKETKSVKINVESPSVESIALFIAFINYNLLLT
ncbi:MAG: DUF2807 domain-containing protein, partial [Candidatus Riflebacteria bacterium]|nr:DUF2807 domain-containing protein [Candidatus Riflebacteria bacterium]